ncbi:hypothetical protein OAS39_07805 [Pirellulales bacterium]|nr:hypothetical protein [Pirellulales bacterium]
MFLRRGSKFAFLTFSALSLLPISNADAEDFVSEQFGFRFTVPDGFVEYADEEPMRLSDGTPMTVALFAEEVQTDDVPITIVIQRVGQIVDPNQWLDVADLPKQDAIELSLESRRWQETELQVIRQEGSLAPGIIVRGYLIQFPLKDEAIQIRVQGPQSRSDDVLRVFDMSVEGFVNTKTYIMRIEPAGPTTGSAQSAKLMLGLLATLVLAVSFICVAGHLSWPQANRPLGIAFVALLGLVNGAWTAGQHLLTLADVYSSPDDSVSMSNAFTVNLIGDLFFSSVAIFAFVGLILGAKWGWWMGAFFWTWRVCNLAFFSDSTSVVGNQPAVTSGYAELLVGLTAIGLLLAYLYRKTVLEYFRLSHFFRPYLIVGISGILLSIAGVFHLLESYVTR